MGLPRICRKRFRVNPKVNFKAVKGGLICRGVISKLKNHNIDTFISLSAPLNGQYGETDYIRDTMPNVPKKETYWKLFYTKIGQRASVGGYWRDPFHLKEYLKWSNFLAPLNGESGNGSTMNHRASFLKVRIGHQWVALLRLDSLNFIISAPINFFSDSTNRDYWWPRWWHHRAMAICPFWKFLSWIKLKNRSCWYFRFLQKRRFWSQNCW